jgi:tRNA (guanine-N7-)-methyltransferase
VAKAYPRSNYESYRGSRNPYATRFAEFLGDTHPHGLTDHDTEKNRGRWRAFFRRPETSFLQVELGAYHGETSIELAEKNPEELFVGIEWKYKISYKAASKAKAKQLGNLCFLRANMSRLPWMFAPGEVDQFVVFFPDPWSKLSQNKWRVLHEGFFRSLGNLLSQGKSLLIKTDHPSYAEYIQESLTTAGCFDLMPAAQAEAAFQKIPPTPFERIFLSQGLKIHSFALVRNAKLVAPPEELKEIFFPI